MHSEKRSQDMINSHGGILQAIAWVIFLASIFLIVILFIFETELTLNMGRAFFDLLRMGGILAYALLFLLILSSSLLALTAYRQYQENHHLWTTIDQQKKRISRLMATPSAQPAPLVTGASHLTLTAMRYTESAVLTPHYLAKVVAPYLVAMTDLQFAVDRMYERPSADPRIYSLTQASPISISLDGLGEAIKTIRNMVVRWRREHERKLTKLLEAEKELENEKRRAEILLLRAQASHTREDTRLLGIQAEEHQAKIQQMLLLVEEQRAALANGRQLLANNIGQTVGAYAPAEKQAAFVREIEGPLEVLAESPLETSSGDEGEGRIRERPQ